MAKFNCEVCHGGKPHQEYWLDHLVKLPHLRKSRKHFEALDVMGDKERKKMLLIKSYFPLISGTTKGRNGKEVKHQQDTAGVVTLLQKCSSNKRGWEVKNFLAWAENPKLGLVKFSSERQLQAALIRLQAKRKRANLYLTCTLDKEHCLRAAKLNEISEVELSKMLPAKQVVISASTESNNLEEAFEPLKIVEDIQMIPHVNKPSVPLVILDSKDDNDVASCVVLDEDTDDLLEGGMDDENEPTSPPGTNQNTMVPPSFDISDSSSEDEVSNNSSAVEVSNNSAEAEVSDNSSEAEVSDNSSEAEVSDNSSEAEVSYNSSEAEVSDNSSEAEISDNRSEPEVHSEFETDFFEDPCLAVVLPTIKNRSAPRLPASPGASQVKEELLNSSYTTMRIVCPPVTHHHPPQVARLPPPQIAHHPLPHVSCRPPSQAVHHPPTQVAHHSPIPVSRRPPTQVAYHPSQQIARSLLPENNQRYPHASLHPPLNDPPNPMMQLHELAADQGWPNPVYTFMPSNRENSGPSHLLNLCRVTANGQEYKPSSSAVGGASTPQEAQQNAAMICLNHLSMRLPNANSHYTLPSMTAPARWVMIENKPEKRQLETHPLDYASARIKLMKTAPGTQYNPISDLYNYAARRRWPRPMFQFSSSYGKWTCTVLLNNVKYPTNGYLPPEKTEKLAKRKAAEYVIKALASTDDQHQQQTRIPAEEFSTHPAANSLQSEVEAIRKVVCIPPNEIRKATDAVTALKVALDKYHSYTEVTMFRNWYLDLLNPSTVSFDQEALLVFCHSPTNYFSDCVSYLPGTLKSFKFLEKLGKQKWLLRYMQNHIKLTLVKDPQYLVEAQMCRLAKYLMTFDSRCKHVMTLAYYWARINFVSFGLPNNNTNLPAQVTLPWLVIFFLCHQKIIPTPEEIMTRSRTVWFDPQNQYNVGFDTTLEHVEWWKFYRTGTQTKNPRIGTAVESLILFQSFLQFYGSIFTGHVGNEALVLHMSNGKLSKVLFSTTGNKLLRLVNPLDFSDNYSVARNIKYIFALMQQSAGQLEKFLHMRLQTSDNIGLEQFGSLENVLNVNSYI